MVEEMSKLSRDKVIGFKESFRQVMPQHVSRTPRYAIHNIHICLLYNMIINQSMTSRTA